MKTLREYIDQLDEISRRDFLKGAGAAAVAGAAGYGANKLLNDPTKKWNTDLEDYDELDQQHKTKTFYLFSTNDQLSLNTDPKTNQASVGPNGNWLFNSFSTLRIKVDNDPAETIQNITGGQGGFRFQYPSKKLLSAKQILVQVAVYNKETMTNPPYPNKEDYKIFTFIPGQNLEPKEGVEEEVDEDVSPDAVKRIEQLVQYK